jgi:hypothetical protein
MEMTMVTWSETNYLQQKADIALAMGQLESYEHQAYAVTLHKNTIPTATELADQWRAVVGKAPDIGSKIQWWDTINSEIGDSYVFDDNEVLAEFVPVDPTPVTNWELFGSLYQDASTPSTDWNLTIPQTHKNLRILITSKSLDTGGVRESFKLRFNNDAGSDYGHQIQGVWDATAQALGIANNNEVYLFHHGTSLNNDVDTCGSFDVEITNYCDGSLDSIVFSARGMSSVQDVALATRNVANIFHAELWELTNDITQINFLDLAGWAPGTRIAVYGVYPK